MTLSTKMQSAKRIRNSFACIGRDVTKRNIRTKERRRKGKERVKERRRETEKKREREKRKAWWAGFY